LTVIQDNFVNIKSNLQMLNVDSIDGILFDLGVSSFQFDTPERGFSYQYDHQLDMRMNQDASLDAYEIVNTYSEKAIADILFQYGEEPFARIIARNIVKNRAMKPISTTLELVEVVKQSLPDKVLRKKGHPAKQTFQALRIAVNDELAVLRLALTDAISLLKPGGRIVTITFHSLEDRICKLLFRDLSTITIPKGVMILPTEKPLISLVTKHVVTPSETEIVANNRAKSAKLRAAEKNR
jgi:16S rRNA (cytosine1402-N4)-methyltransferase